MKTLLLFVTYQIISLLALPFGLVYLLIRRIKGKPSIGSLAQRLGWVPTAAPEKKTIWIHAVSVGEIAAVQHLIKTIEAKTNRHVYLTVGTRTGFQTAQRLITCSRISYLPFDFLPFVVLASQRIKPYRIIIVESELWPNFLMVARFFKAPLYLLNARIPKRSSRRYRQWAWLYRYLFSLFTTIYAESARQKKAFEQLGVNPNNISIMGNIKAANVLKKDLTPEHLSNHSFTLLAGSIHPDEEKILLNAWAKLITQQRAKCIIAPRHFHWQDRLICAVKKLAVPYAIWQENSITCYPSGTTFKPHSTHPAHIADELLESVDIIVVCTLGKLFDLYQVADLYLLGGTFVPIGGHNLLEPCAWHKASVIGPHHANCADIKEHLARKGSVITAYTQDELYTVLTHLADNPAQLAATGKRCGQWLMQEGARVEKNIASFLTHLSQ